jgi:hypothetical protein
VICFALSNDDQSPQLVVRAAKYFTKLLWKIPGLVFFLLTVFGIVPTQEFLYLFNNAAQRRKVSTVTETATQRSGYRKTKCKRDFSYTKS